MMRLFPVLLLLSVPACQERPPTPAPAPTPAPQESAVEKQVTALAANLPSAPVGPSVKPPESALTTDSGLSYKVLEPGRKGASPRDYDVVTLHFIGWDEEGKVIEDSRKRGFTSVVKLNETMPGWAEALVTMTEGEKRRLWLAPGLGYKAKPNKPARPVVFDLELLKVKEGIAPLPPPADVAAPPTNAKRTDTGLAYRRLKRGKGKRHPRDQDLVFVNLGAWTTDGKNIENSATNGAPAKRVVKKNILGLAEGLQLMMTGDKYRFWIPHELAHKHYPGVHQGMLVYDVELVSIELRPNPPPTPKQLAPPPGAKKTKMGVAYVTRKKGKGKEHPKKKSVLLLHVSSWARDGTLISSTQTQGQPTMLKMHKVMPEVRELLADIVEGETRHAWLREDQMFLGNKSQRDVLIEIKLIQIGKSRPK